MRVNASTEAATNETASSGSRRVFIERSNGQGLPLLSQGSLLVEAAQPPSPVAAAIATFTNFVGKSPSARTAAALARSAALTYGDRIGVAIGAPAAGSRMYM